MMLGAASWRSRTSRAALALTALLVAGATAHAQNFVRPPNLNIGPRASQINNPNVGIAGVNVVRVPSPNTAGAVHVNPAATTPYAHYSPNLYPSCAAAFRDADGECLNAPVTTVGGGGASSGKGKGKGSGGNNTLQNALNLRSFNNRIVAELEGTYTDEQAEALGRRPALGGLSLQASPLTGAPGGLSQIPDGRSYEAASRDFAAASGVVSVQR